MEIFIIGYSILALFVLFLLIKKAVTAGIDSSVQIKLLRREIKDLKEQLEKERKTDSNNHMINKKV